MPLHASLAAALADRYRLERELGQGGMATVYLAEDLKHKRRVAVKVLKPELAAVLGAERFVQEITTTAALQHPHILPLFDSGDADGFLFYVMPFIDGETLRSRLDRETLLSVEDALKITTDVADALHHAHTQGVIHRDIKPENILLANGRPVVADFGIALAVSAAAGGRITETGLSLGTPHYMSPEQATADKEISARSDVYSLASVLYEMLAGEPPHSGGSAQQVIMKIVTEEAAPVTARRRNVPPHVSDALAVALEKLPADRFASARAFAGALATPTFRRRGTTAINEAGAASEGAVRTRTAWPVATRIALSLAALGMAVGGGWALRGASREPIPPPAVRFALTPVGEGVIRDPGGSSIAVAPDGRRLVYTGRDSLGVPRLYVRDLDATTARALPGTEDASAPFFSPDGAHIGFSQRGQLRRMPLAGGAVTTVISESNTGASWGADDWIYLASYRRPELRRVPARGGAAEFVGRGDTTSTDGWRFLEAMPDGRGVLVTLVREGRPELAAVSLPDGVLHRFDEPGMSPRWLTGGHLVFLRPDGVLMLTRLDEARWRLVERPVPIASNVSFGPAFVGKFGVSRNGVLAFLEGGVSTNRDMNLVSRDGRRDVLIESVAAEVPRFSPDGRRIVYELQDLGRSTQSDVWMLDVASRTTTRLTTDRSSHSPAWFPDARHIAYISGRHVLRLPIDRSTPPDTLATLPGPGYDLELGPDATLGYVLRSYAVGNSLILRVPLRSDAPTRVVGDSSWQYESLALSPDGDWLAHASFESGRRRPYVRRLASGEGVWPMPGEEPTELRWRGDGGALLYREGDRLMSIDFTPGLEPTFGEARPFIDSMALGFAEGGRVRWDPSPDGQQAVVMVPRDAQSLARTMVVMLGWLEQLGAVGTTPSGSPTAPPEDEALR